MHALLSISSFGVPLRFICMAYGLNIASPWSLGGFKKDLAPEVLTLEIGTNDLSRSAPEDLVRFLLSFPVRVISVCHVIPRAISYPHASLFSQHAYVLNNYVRVVFEDIPNVFCWTHMAFNSPVKDFYVKAGVHLNPTGNISLLIKSAWCLPPQPFSLQLTVSWYVYIN